MHLNLSRPPPRRHPALDHRPPPPPPSSRSADRQPSGCSFPVVARRRERTREHGRRDYNSRHASLWPFDIIITDLRMHQSAPGR
ncbi:hypothetical protein chiPu_0024148 [Chiloscyllium punctatum]|uniref:Uncharacterized protein n=1 Tax=Chiloscyllium punctatum TaxID=137246 RepID=A0A401TBS2_CHIPU|nr:hypothetical protein [Chiloscyllium punctatum]